MTGPDSRCVIARGTGSFRNDVRQLRTTTTGASFGPRVSAAHRGPTEVVAVALRRGEGVEGERVVVLIVRPGHIRRGTGAAFVRAAEQPLDGTGPRDPEIALLAMRLPL